MNDLDITISELRRELTGVDGDASIEKQRRVIETVEKIMFYATRKMLYPSNSRQRTDSVKVEARDGKTTEIVFLAD